MWVALAIASAAAAFGLARAGFPAALLLGPMLVAIAFGAGGTALRVPRWAFLGAQGVVGCLIARAVNPPLLASLATDWAIILAVVLATVVASALVGWALAKFGALGAATAAWGSAPGAAAAMTAMSEEFGADPRLVAIMQYVRVIVVVLTASLVARLVLGVGSLPPASTPSGPLVPPLVPFLETLAIALGGAWLGRRLRVPAGPLLFPLVAGSVLHATGVVAIALPVWLLGLAYAIVGWYIGLMFTRETVRAALRALPQLIAATLGLIALCALSAWMLAGLLHVDPLTAYLATTPGGLDSVAIIALGSGSNVSLILAVQAVRVFVVVLTGPPLAKLIARYA
jgi:membrane AbrB-like protein